MFCSAPPSVNKLALTTERQTQFDWSAINKRWTEPLLAHRPDLMLLPARVKPQSLMTVELDILSDVIEATAMIKIGFRFCISCIVSAQAYNVVAKPVS
jgi:hypothetical protein